MILSSNINNWYALSDPAIVKQLGESIKHMRLNKNVSQQQLADQAGVDRVTISKFENGRGATLLTFIQLLRALGKLELLHTFSEEPVVSPLMVAEAEERYRKRASKPKKGSTPSKESEW